MVAFAPKVSNGAVNNAGCGEGGGDSRMDGIPTNIGIVTGTVSVATIVVVSAGVDI